MDSRLFGVWKLNDIQVEQKNGKTAASINANSKEEMRQKGSSLFSSIELDNTGTMSVVMGDGTYVKATFGIVTEGRLLIEFVAPIERSYVFSYSIDGVEALLTYVSEDGTVCRMVYECTQKL